MRFRLVKYLLKLNSFSSSRVWYRVYVWRVRFEPLPKSNWNENVIIVESESGTVAFFATHHHFARATGCRMTHRFC
jgi:hypothetical protein